MFTQELQCIQKTRRLHKDWAMRLEAFSQGLPVDMSKLEEVTKCMFLKDIQLLCEDITSCPCYGKLVKLYQSTHDWVVKYLENPSRQDMPAIPDIVVQMNQILEALDALEQWIEAREESKVQQVIAEQQTEAESVIDTLEKSTQELDALLNKHD